MALSIACIFFCSFRCGRIIIKYISANIATRRMIMLSALPEPEAELAKIITIPPCN